MARNGKEYCKMKKKEEIRNYIATKSSKWNFKGHSFVRKIESDSNNFTTKDLGGNE